MLTLVVSSQVASLFIQQLMKLKLIDITTSWSRSHATYRWPSLVTALNYAENHANWCRYFKVVDSQMQWPRLILQVKNQIVVSNVRWRHWYHKFVQYSVKWCVQIETMLKCNNNMQIGTVVLKVPVVKYSGLIFSPPCTVIVDHTSVISLHVLWQTRRSNYWLQFTVH